MNQLIRRNSECLLTLVGVVCYEELKSVTKALGIGWAAVLFGVVLTVVGVAMTLISAKDMRGKGESLVIHMVLWVLKGLVGWIMGIAIGCYIIYQCFLKSGSEKPEKSKEAGEMTFDQLPANLYSGTTCYKRIADFGWGTEYANESNPSERFTITVIYSATSSGVDTNAGHFFF